MILNGRRGGSVTSIFPAALGSHFDEAAGPPSRIQDPLSNVTSKIGRKPLPSKILDTFHGNNPIFRQVGSRLSSQNPSIAQTFKDDMNMPSGNNDNNKPEKEPPRLRTPARQPAFPTLPGFPQAPSIPPPPPPHCPDSNGILNETGIPNPGGVVRNRPSNDNYPHPYRHQTGRRRNIGTIYNGNDDFDDSIPIHLTSTDDRPEEEGIQGSLGGPGVPPQAEGILRGNLRPNPHIPIRITPPLGTRTDSPVVGESSISNFLYGIGGAGLAAAGYFSRGGNGNPPSPEFQSPEALEPETQQIRSEIIIAEGVNNVIENSPQVLTYDEALQAVRNNPRYVMATPDAAYPQENAIAIVNNIRGAVDRYVSDNYISPQQGVTVGTVLDTLNAVTTDVSYIREAFNAASDENSWFSLVSAVIAIAGLLRMGYRRYIRSGEPVFIAEGQPDVSEIAVVLGTDTPQVDARRRSERIANRDTISYADQDFGPEQTSSSYAPGQRLEHDFPAPVFGGAFAGNNTTFRGRRGQRRHSDGDQQPTSSRNLPSPPPTPACRTESRSMSRSRSRQMSERNGASRNSIPSLMGRTDSRNSSRPGSRNTSSGKY